MSPAITSAVLDTAAFEQAVLSPAPAVAVFDCDGTLWSGDAGSAFMKWTIDSGLVSREVVDIIDHRYRAYLRGDVSELAICGEMVAMYEGLQVEEMRSAARLFFSHYIHARIFPEMQSLIARLHALGTEIWAVSSTNDWVIEAGVHDFGIPPERVLAARVRTSAGRVTSEILDVPTDQGKVDSLRRAGITAPDAVFGNSIHDAAMLAIAARPFAVNPTPALVSQATAAGWSMYLPLAVRP